MRCFAGLAPLLLLAASSAAQTPDSLAADSLRNAPEALPLRLGWVDTPFVPDVQMTANVAYLFLNDVDVRLDRDTRLSLHASLPFLALRGVSAMLGRGEDETQDFGAAVEVHRTVFRTNAVQASAMFGAATGVTGVTDVFDGRTLFFTRASAIPTRLRGRVAVGGGTPSASWAMGVGGAVSKERSSAYVFVGRDVRLGGRWHLAADLAAIPWSDSVYADWDPITYRSRYTKRRYLTLPFSAVVRHVRPSRGGHEVLRFGVLGQSASRSDTIHLGFPFGAVSYVLVPYFAIEFPVGG